MTSSYAYTPYIWPSVLTVLLLIALSFYSGRRRGVPGASQFTIGCLFAAAWAAGSALEVAAVDTQTKIFWARFQSTLSLPILIAITCFILEYAWPGRWLTRRNIILLSIPPLIVLGLLLIDDLTHLLWRSFVVDGSIFPQYGPVGWIIVTFDIVVIGIINIIVFVWLFLRSPQQRWPVVIMFTGLVGGRVFFMLDKLYVFRAGPSLDILGMSFEFLMYAIALYGFHIFDPIPLARQTVIAQMREGVMVLDPQERVVDLNPAACAILGQPGRRLQGRQIRELLPPYSLPVDGGAGESEISLGTGMETFYYLLETSALKDWRGLEIGRLLMLHDVTGQKRAQAQLLEQQRALAMLHEREQLGRELHDGIGQVLGYVKIQAQAARDCLAQDQNADIDSHLAKLMAAAQDAQVDVREYILGTKTTASGQPGFLPALRQYLQRFSKQYGLHTELVEPPDWSDDVLVATVEVQLLRVIQEALTNARKHALAQSVQVIVHLDGNRAQVIVQDDGIGFDPADLKDGEGQKYGLGFMRQRAEEVDGSLAIHSAPGEGTRVVVEVPVWVKGREADVEKGRKGEAVKGHRGGAVKGRRGEAVKGSDGDGK